MPTHTFFRPFTGQTNKYLKNKYLIKGIRLYLLNCKIFSALFLSKKNIMFLMST